MKWWLRYPERLKNEVEHLKTCGFKTTSDAAKINDNVVEISTSYLLGGREYCLRIVFPDLYPYFRPLVYCSDLTVPHHQNPFDGNLCLLGRNSDNWHPEQYIADVIAEQLPKLLDSERVVSAGGKPEEEFQAEPWTEYLAPNFEFRITWDTNINVPAGSIGKLELTYTPHTDVYKAYVSHIASNGQELFTATQSPIPEAKSKTSIPYIRLNTVPPQDLEELVPIVQGALGKYEPQGLVRRLTGRTQGTLLAVFYPEETAHRQDGIGLVFVLFARSKSGNVMAHYIKAYRSGSTSIWTRMGPYGDIYKNKVLLVGFGSLGSAVATNLCKLGVREITIVDRDILEPGNTTRHYLGFRYFGMDKVAAAADALSAAYPYTTIKPLSYKLGDAGAMVNSKTEEFLAELSNSDVIVDCSAERAVQHLLSDEAWQQNKRYFLVETYPGVLGGFIGLVEPGHGPCYYCFLNGLATGAIAPPPVLSEGTVQPPGCGEPAFVGTPFDAETIADAAVRLIFGSLASGAGRYPRPAGTFYRVALASEDTKLSRVSIESVDIPRRGDCAKCGRP